MIKCILSGKSLKQLFIISLISCFILLGSSFVNAFVISPIGQNITSPNDSNVIMSVLPYGSFLSNVLGNGKPVLTFKNTAVSATRGNYTYFMWINGKIYYYSVNYYGSSTTPRLSQGFLSIYRICDYIDENSIALSNCNSVNYSEDTVNDFLNTVKIGDYYYINGTTSNSYYYGTVCMSSSVYNKSICFGGSNNSYFGFTGSLDYGTGLSFDELYGYDSSSPAVPISPTPSTGNNQITIGGGMDGYDYTKIDTGDLVFYFENNPYYRYDEGVCYIGTDDFDTLYSSGSTLGLFRANNGGTIFDLFSDKFGNNFTLNNVGSFINAWNINYFTWFKGGNRDENNIPLFNAYYTLGSGFYQDFSDDLIVPFIGNPIAYYFMGYVSSLYGEYPTQGQSISTYCYYKLGLDKNSGGLDITDDTSNDYLNNASDFINQHNKFYGLNSSGINIQSQSWNGSILDYFTGGENNYDFNSFFSSSFNKFKNVISLDPSDLGVGVLPTYIILFLMAIILFRFLSH